VPCAAEESGSLITVEDAKKARVPVYGVPGSLYEIGQQGVNRCIAEGDMKAVYSLEQFVNSLHLKEKDTKIVEKKNLMLSDEQKNVYEYLQGGDSGAVEEIAVALDQSPLEISMILTELEMEGLVYEERPGVWKSK
jgi:predicted Rossmann fold nucleotide-binding protein DprA/Smf involved in DNA uptake